MKINKVAEAVESMEIIDKQKKVLETAKDTLKETVKKVQSDRNNRVYYGLDRLPSGMASNQITDGCLVLEGGAFRGLYTSGVCDALMEENINMRATIGISAGGMNGVNYVSGQIGWMICSVPFLNFGQRHTHIIDKE